ncbi:helix-turn-helix domain-containing protein [Dyella soli]
MHHGAYGERLGRSFGLNHPPVLQAETQQGVRLAVTELQIGRAGYGITGPMGVEDAYLICLNLLGQTTHELWYDGRSVCSGAYAAGSVYVIDLRCDPVTYIGDPLHSLYFYLPREALREASACPGAGGAADLATAPGKCFQDAIITSIGHTLLPIFGSQGGAHQKLVEHLLQGLCAYMAAEYGGSRKSAPVTRGALAPWQQRMAMQMMRERIFEGVSVSELAEACRISVGALIRGFKKGTGLSPHQWLLSRRLELALDLMADPDASLADIACNVGFSDQSHLSRVFTQKMGVTPRVWRKSLANDGRAMA